MLTWKSYKIARITGKPINEVERIIAEKHDYDVIVSEGLYTDVQKRNEFIDIIQLCQALNLEMPVDLVIEKSTIQGKLPLQKALAEERRQKDTSNKNRCTWRWPNRSRAPSHRCRDRCYIVYWP